MQKCPPRQLHSCPPAGDISGESPPINPSACPDDPPISAEQFFLLALTDPSLQMKVLPWQWEIPPLRPLHGVFVASAECTLESASSAAKILFLNSCTTSRPNSTGNSNNANRDKIVRARAISLVLALTAVVNQSAAQPLVGVPTVIDGDTIEIHGQRIRLNGIDAPESAQICVDAALKKYRCGQKASLALADFLRAHRPTSCIEVDRDQFRRMVAVCTAGGLDIGEWIVRKGYAVDWPKYSAGFYAKAETGARKAKRGLWAGSFDAPWEWRKQMTVQ